MINGLDSVLYFNIYENTKDFFKHSIISYKQVYTENETNYINKEYAKYSLLHLSSAIELVFKIKLMEHSKDLIFDNIEDYSERKLELGSFKSVDINKAIKRLKYFLNIDIDFKDDLDSLKRVRNKFEHFGIIKDIDIAKNTINKNFKNITNFIAEYMIEFYNEEYKDIEQELKNLGIVE